MERDLLKEQLAELPFPAPLRQYQWDGVSFLFRNEGALLADDMGLGKTVQTAVALRLLLRSAAVSRALIVTPAALTLNWEREILAWAPELVVRRVTGTDIDREAYYALPIEVLIASYDQVRLDGLDRIPDGTFDLVILDEAQRIKNRDSRTATACRLLPRSRSWALTGTPVENSRADIESIFAFVRPGLLRKTYGKQLMFSLIEPFMLRRRKSEVLAELPPIIYQDLRLELTPRQREAYDAVWSDRQASLPHEHPVPTTALFALLTKLKQLCNFEPASGESSKAEALTTLLDAQTTTTDKVIVFSQYVETLKWISAQLSIKNELYTGELSTEERDAVITRFETEPGPRVLLTSLRAGGVGLNLQAATVVVLFDRWWNPAVEAQAINRAHRFGRQVPLHVVRFLVSDTVEERIDEVLSAKRALFEEYVEGAPTADVEQLSREELVRILGLRNYDVQ